MRVQFSLSAQIMKKVLVILGPTASGKSELAVKLAQKFNGEIISADSRQVYKDLNVGTGKITKKEMRGIPHYLLDVANPNKQFTAARYKELALNSLQYIVTNSRLPIIVGGTGFYIDALTGTVSLPDVPPNQKLREKLNRKSATELFKILKKKDPRRAKTVDQNNKVRLIRALEIIKALGRVPALIPSVNKNWKFIFIGLKPNDLDKRIEKRVKKMFKDGLLNEVKKLKGLGVSNKRLKELGFEYWNPTEESVVRESKKYAKRQMTWFKRNKKIKWFKPEDLKEIEKYVRMALLGD
ncbi:MAG: tRNA (adenosine(37)-N6)-dimethylallyltransferase MiaA [bacterium]|nr:tRNA (adenosine(37)-N6)-dimethylallyltransferase MiaA [bacterium]